MTRRLRLFDAICVLVVPWLAVQAQSASLQSHRLAGADYVAVSDLARSLGLGRDFSRVAGQAEYKTSFAQLSLRADRRDIQVNGINHWLGAPVLFARGRLWVGAMDARKTIIPILSPERLRTTATVHTIILDPGHGGSDRGTHGRSDRNEKEFTLDLAKRVERYLAGTGVDVILTRTSDRALSLDERVGFCQTRKGDVFVSLHFNSGGSAAGIETFCLPVAGTASTASPPSRTGEAESTAGNRFDENNVWLAHCVQSSLLRATGAEDRGVRCARFYVLRYANCPAILVEAGFLSNRAEEQKILTADYRDVLAKAIAEGILKYKRSVEIAK